MATDFHTRVQKLLEKTVQIPPERRTAFLRKACAGKTVLLREVRSLLPHYEKMGGYDPPRPGKSVWQLPRTTTLDRLRLTADVEEEAPRKPPFCLGPYRVKEILGRGGMGVVYRAIHATLRKPVAIKVLRRKLASSEERRQFALEVEILRNLRHPNIARLMYADTIGETRVAAPYFVMECIEGQTLVRYAEENQFDTRRRLALLVEICAAVEHAHQRGIIHCDLKPDNILIDAAGRPKILDFGIARITTFSSEGAPQEVGRFAGTPAYASPEQLSGRGAPLKPRTDVYSLGLIAHELLTGRLPRSEGGRRRLDLQAVRLNADTLRDNADEKTFRYYLKIILTNALAKSEDERYASAGPFGQDWEGLLACCAEPASGWAKLKRRALALFSPRPAWQPSSLARPLQAVVRTRIDIALRAGHRPPG